MVEIVDDLGAPQLLLVRWAGSSVHVLTSRERAFRPGDRVRPRVAAERVVVWPASLG